MSPQQQWLAFRGDSTRSIRVVSWTAAATVVAIFRGIIQKLPDVASLASMRSGLFPFYLSTDEGTLAMTAVTIARSILSWNS